MRVPRQLGDFPASPIPILQENQLHRLHRGTPHLQVGVPPGADARVLAQILFAHIQPSKKGLSPVDHHDLAVVAEVQLKARPPAAVCPKGIVSHASLPEFLQEASRQLDGAHFIEQEIHPHSGPRAFDQRLLEPVAHPVVFHHVKVHQHILPSTADGIETRLVGLLPVDQQLQLIAPRERQSAEDLRPAGESVLHRQLVLPQPQMHVLRGLAQFLIVHAAAPHVARESTMPGDPVKRDGQKWKRCQRNDPRDRSLRRPRVHQRMNDVQKADHVQNDDPTQFECEGPCLLGHPRNLATGKPVSKAAKTEQAGQASACPDLPEATH